ncbi:MAG TPA: hypothetical protein VD838_05910 [Anaeromyxobacteraceae bacterium]|nr:hypothetical protein [Anaeromyxobacteraceae bacterium]
MRQLEHLKPTQALFLYPADPNEPQACGVPIWPAETRPDRVELQARWLAEKPRGLRGGRHG